jgi:phosphoribosyl-AMP cyclohydrolase / phosphoribosyl-ATP pyrophosphohydrolase
MAQKASQEFKFDELGLVPAVIQDWMDGTVLMLGYMNQEAIAKTLSTQSVHFWSRSRNKLWEKGETSGNKLRVKEVFIDCDRDTILVKAEQIGPTCHTGERSCFFSEVDSQGVAEEKSSKAFGGILEGILRTIQSRRTNPQPGSYTTKLFEDGHDKILKKVAEEAGEVLIAAKGGKKDEIIYEVADLFFHALMVLGYHDISLQEVYQELGKRFGKSGLKPEK